MMQVKVQVMSGINPHRFTEDMEMLINDFYANRLTGLPQGYKPIDDAFQMTSKLTVVLRFRYEVP